MSKLYSPHKVHFLSGQLSYIKKMKKSLGGIFHGPDAEKRLYAFQNSTTSSDKLTIFTHFSPDLEQQIDGLDAEETLEMVLRFPGLPDALGGRLQGMPDHQHWLTFGEQTAQGQRVSFHSHLPTIKLMPDYLDLLSAHLGWAVQTTFSAECLTELQLSGPVRPASHIVTSAPDSFVKVVLLKGRVLFGGALAFDTESESTGLLTAIERTYGIHAVLVNPNHDVVRPFDLAACHLWLEANSQDLPIPQNPFDSIADAAESPVLTLAQQACSAFDLIVLDFDDTLAHTSPLKSFLDSGTFSGPDWEAAFLQTSYPDEVRVWLRSLKQTSKGIKLAVLSKAPRQYLDAHLKQGYPDIKFDAVLGHDEARVAGHKYKPDPTLLLELMMKFGVSADRTLVIGDDEADIEMAYRAGAQSLLVGFYETGWTFDNGLQTLPNAVCAHPKSIASVVATLHLHDLPLDAVRNGCPADQLLRQSRHTTVFSIKKGSKRLATTVLGRYFSAAGGERDTYVLPARSGHLLTSQILEKENGQQDVPEAWVQGVAMALKDMAQRNPQGVVATIIPAKVGRLPRLENLLTRVEAALAGAHPKLVFQPDVFQFASTAQSNKTLNGEERTTNLAANLHLHPGLSIQLRHIYVVIDDVTTTGSTFFRARELLETRGVDSGSVRAIAIAKTISFRPPQRRPVSPSTAAMIDIWC